MTHFLTQDQENETAKEGLSTSKKRITGYFDRANEITLRVFEELSETAGDLHAYYPYDSADDMSDMAFALERLEEYLFKVRDELEKISIKVGRND
tara:strand:+ start:974 stop:1258 length:285 start_codon:yes stop_codon:yes gene_type:complete